MRTESITLQHERVDDIPLLIGFIQRLKLPELLERHLGSHHLHQGLPNGTLAAVWLAFILSEANHCKVSVQDWAQRHQHTLTALLGQSLRAVEFSDDRLSIVLRRLQDASWPELEADLWEGTCQVYQLPLECIRLDSTTSYGYHRVTEEGIMQHGHSKDHRPDLPQLKLMAAAAQPTSQVIACDLVPGNAADDPLYLPLIVRVRQQLKQRGLLYAGDCKMAALATRADIAAHGDYYLMPLPRTGEAAAEWDNWIEDVLGDPKGVQKLYREDENGKRQQFARGRQWEEQRQGTVAGEEFVWSERVQVVQALALAERQAEQLDERLRGATAELHELTPPVGRGHRQQRDEAGLCAAVAAVLEQRRVEGLLAVQWQREEEVSEHYAGRGRGGPERKKVREIKVRYVITAVQRNESAIARAKERLGWRVQVTNLVKNRYGLQDAVLLYNGGWSLERDFHVLKDRPLGIQPLYVREEEQIIGLTRLLTIALRVLTLIEIMVRGGLEESEEELRGLYEGQPKRKTGRPTAVRLLRAITRMAITAIGVVQKKVVRWQVSALPKLLKRILELLKLSPTLYTQLGTDSG
jgi:transposase